MKTYREFIEKKSDYEIYHDSYTSAIYEMEVFVSKNGYMFAETEDEGKEILSSEIGSGPAKPGPGKTNRFSLELWKKGKKTKKGIHFQIYNRGHEHNNNFELNMYIS